MDKEKMQRAEQEELRTPEQILRERYAAIFPGLEEAALDAGLDELYSRHPELDAAALATDGLFAIFARGRGEDIAGIYEDYEELRQAMEQRLSAKLEKRADRSTAAGAARIAGTRAGLSDAQFALLAQWNREHPEYKMTAREYAAALKN